MNHNLFGTMKYKDESWNGKATLPKFPSGLAAPLPIVINDPEKKGPSEQQEKAAELLMAKTDHVFRAVAQELLNSYRAACEQEDWLKPIESLDELSDEDFELSEVQIHREHHKGTSFLAFFFEAAWAGDGQLYIVYHPNKPAVCTEPSGLMDVIESDEPVGPEFVPSPNQELVDAILEGDDKKAKALIAGGMDINELNPDEYPPLWVAAGQMQPELVRRLLAYGADPNLKNPDEKTTTLQHVRRMYREMGFSSSTKNDPMADIMKQVMKGPAGDQMALAKNQLEEIIQMLEAAGAKK